jgi:hypothetical protein
VLNVLVVAALFCPGRMLFFEPLAVFYQPSPR